MLLEELMKLANEKKVTDVSVIDFYKNNAEALNKLSKDDLIQYDLLNDVNYDDDFCSTLNEMLNTINNGRNIYLGDNIDLVDTSLIITQNQTINLNDKEILGGVFTENNGEIEEGSTDSYVFWVKSGILNIEGNGVVKSQNAKYSMAVWANGGTVNIYGGEFINEGEGCDLIYASNGGTVNIYGGEFKATAKGNDGTANDHSALNIKDKDREISKILVYGGKFFGFDPANNVSEGPNTNFVAPGYKSVEIEEGVFEVIKM